MLRPQADLMDARDQRRAARCADTGGGEGIGETHPLSGQPVELGCAGHRIAKGADVGAQVFGHQNQDIGGFGGGWRAGAEFCQKRRHAGGLHHCGGGRGATHADNLYDETHEDDNFHSAGRRRPEHPCLSLVAS